jgi:hypothetical protein
MTIDEINSREPEFKYQLLARLEQDCKYFLGNGNGANKHLWGDTPEEHIGFMKGIWNSFPEEGKPEWLSFEEILRFEREMLEGLYFSL